MCDECKGPIARGEQYEIVKMLYEKWEVWRTCRHCISLRKAFFCHGYMYGCIRDDIREHIVWELQGEIGCGCVEGLTDAAKEHIFELMDEAFEQYGDDE